MKQNEGKSLDKSTILEYNKDVYSPPRFRGSFGTVETGKIPTERAGQNRRGIFREFPEIRTEIDDERFGLNYGKKRY